VNVTATASVVAKLAAVAYTPTGATTTTATVPTFNGKGDVDGIMVLDGSNYRYNLVAYKSAPNVVVGSDAIQVDTK
jgi:hypothetical protein